MPAVQGIDVWAAGSAQLGLLCLCPYWVVIGFGDSGL